MLLVYRHGPVVTPHCYSRLPMSPGWQGKNHLVNSFSRCFRWRDVSPISAITDRGPTIEPSFLSDINLPMYYCSVQSRNSTNLLGTGARWGFCIHQSSRCWSLTATDRTGEFEQQARDADDLLRGICWFFEPPFFLSGLTLCLSMGINGSSNPHI